MSQGIPGEPGPSHWEYMAAKMAEVFREAAGSTSSLKAESIPPGILADAARFSELLLSRPSTLPNPLVGANIGLIAGKVIERMTGNTNDSQSYQNLIPGCLLIICFATKKISRAENYFLLPVFDFMSNFFSELAKMGEEERSARFGRRDIETGDDE